MGAIPSVTRHDKLRMSPEPTVRDSPQRRTFSTDSKRSFYSDGSTELTSIKDAESQKIHKGRTIVIQDKEFAMGTNWETDNELTQLKEIVKRESGHNQPIKQCICLFMLICVVCMNLLMPSEHSPSVIGIESCSAHHFSL